MIKFIKEQLDNRRIVREAKAHAKWVKEFEEEFGKAGSKVNVTVLQFSNAMARGMVMRTFDDAGIRRCAFCISIEQLRKRVIEQRRDARGKAREKVVFVCPDHKDTPLSKQKNQQPIPKAHNAGVDRAGTSKPEEMSKLEPEGLIDILDVYERAKDKPLREVHPVIPRVEPR